MELFHTPNGSGGVNYYAICKKLKTTQGDSQTSEEYRFIDHLGFLGSHSLCPELNEANQTATFSIDADGPTFSSVAATPLEIRERKAILGSEYAIFKIGVSYRRRLSLLKEIKTTIVDDEDQPTTTTTLVSSGALRAFFQDGSEEYVLENFADSTPFSPQAALNDTDFNSLVIDDETKSTFELFADRYTYSSGVTADYSPESLDDVKNKIIFAIEETVVVNLSDSTDLSLVGIDGSFVTHYE